MIPILIDPIDHGVLPLLFGEEPVALKYRSAPGAGAELLPDLLAALGLRAPEDREEAGPAPAPAVAELTLELRDPQANASSACSRSRSTTSMADSCTNPSRSSSSESP